MYRESRLAEGALREVDRVSVSRDGDMAASGLAAHGTAASGHEDELVATCSVDDLTDGSMKEVDAADNKKILLVRDQGQFYALSAKCTHYGAPLVKGALCRGRVQCPWHGACFSVSTGDIEDFPGLDSLHKFKVTVTGGQATIRYKTSQLQEKRALPMCRLSKTDPRTFLIIGGGASGALCAETLRQAGYQGVIVMTSRERHLPYDRPKLSKSLDSPAEALALRKKEDYASHDITFKGESEAVNVDFAKKCARFKDGTSIRYDKLLLCTGGSPQTLNIPGQNLKSIFCLRSSDDGNKIVAEAKGKNVVIIGQSFIGLEVAAYLVDKAATITVVGRADTPLKPLLGARIGAVIKKSCMVLLQMLVDRGVRFLHGEGSAPCEFVRGADGRLTALLLADKTRLPADVCVLGIGVRPTTDFIKNSALKMTPDGYILVDKFMQTSVSDVYATGDIVKFPLFLRADTCVNVQHWQMACKHGVAVYVSGQVAGSNMAGKKLELKSVPFFWTVILGKSLRYTGYGSDHDDVVIHGELEAHKFVAFYTKGDKVVAVASMNFDPIVAQAAQMFHNDLPIRKTEIQADPQGWIDQLKKIETSEETTSF